MKIKNKRLLLFSFVVLAFSISFGICFAAPNVTIPGLGPNPTLQDYIKVIFNAIMVLAGIIAAVAFTMGAVQYMTSVGDPTKAGEGKNRMVSAVLGLGLLMGSILILNLINPKIAKIDLVSGVENLGAGLFLTGGPTNIDAPQAVPDTGVLPASASALLYKCLITPQDDYMVYAYPQTGYQGKATVQKLSCNGTVTLGGAKSYSLKQLSPGVYLFSTCDDWNSVNGPFNSPQNDLNVLKNPDYDATNKPWLFSGKVGCVQIVNRPDKKIFYGALPHEGANFQGRCSYILTDAEKGIPMGVITPSSMTIFRLIKGETGGDGIVVSSDSDFHGGFIKLSGEKIKNQTRTGIYYLTAVNNNQGVLIPFGPPAWYADTKPIFDYTGVNTPNEVKIACDTLVKAGQATSCAGSIKNNGNYLLVVHGVKSGSTISSCSVFSPGQSVVNLSTTPALSPGAGGTLFYIEVVAAQNY